MKKLLSLLLAAMMLCSWAAVAGSMLEADP